METIKIELTKEQLERVMDALDYQFDMTENTEEDQANKRLMTVIFSQYLNQ